MALDDEGYQLINCRQAVNLSIDMDLPVLARIALLFDYQRVTVSPHLSPR